MMKPREIEPGFGLAFSRVFSPLVMTSLMESGYSGYLNEILKLSKFSRLIDPLATMGDFFEWVYTCLKISYRSEYVYKNAIANKIFLGRHSTNTAHMFTEFGSANCKADAVIINGTSTAYEIKSEYDSFERLSDQIKAYSDLFDRVYLVSSGSMLSKAMNYIPDEVGLMELSPQYTFRELREAASIKHQVKPEVIFDSLRKSEYTSILNRVFGYVPDVPNTLFYKECKKLFSMMSPIQAHDEMIDELRNRDKSIPYIELINGIVMSLKAYVVNAKVNRAFCARLQSLLRETTSALLMPVN